MSRYSHYGREYEPEEEEFILPEEDLGDYELELLEADLEDESLEDPSDYELELLEADLENEGLSEDDVIERTFDEDGGEFEEQLALLEHGPPATYPGVSPEDAFDPYPEPEPAQRENGGSGVGGIIAVGVIGGLVVASIMTRD